MGDAFSVNYHPCIESGHIYVVDESITRVAQVYADESLSAVNRAMLYAAAPRLLSALEAMQKRYSWGEHLESAACAEARIAITLAKGVHETRTSYGPVHS